MKRRYHARRGYRCQILVDGIAFPMFPIAVVPEPKGVGLQRLSEKLKQGSSKMKFNRSNSTCSGRIDIRMIVVSRIIGMDSCTFHFGGRVLGTKQNMFGNIDLCPKSHRCRRMQVSQGRSFSRKSPKTGNPIILDYLSSCCLVFSPIFWISGLFYSVAGRPDQSFCGRLCAEELKRTGHYGKIGQAFTVLLPTVKSVGVMGDHRIS